MEKNRWMRWDRLMRASHRYTGLLLVPWMVTAFGPFASARNLILDGSTFETGYDGFSCLLAYSWTKHGLAASDPRRGVIDCSTSAHGKCSLKMHYTAPYGPKRLSPWCTFRWAKIKEGQKYAVSLYAKGSRDGQRLSVSVGDNWQDWGWSFFALSTQWQRYSRQITVGKTEGDYAWVLIPFPEDGPAWIDGIQLEEGQLTEVHPGRAVDLGVSCNHPTKYENLFFLGDKVVLNATVFSDLAVKVVDRTGQLLDVEELVFGVVKRRQADANVDSQFGTHGFPHSLLEHCGVRWLRTYLLAWPE